MWTCVVLLNAAEMGRSLAAPVAELERKVEGMQGRPWDGGSAPWC